MDKQNYCILDKHADFETPLKSIKLSLSRTQGVLFYTEHSFADSLDPRKRLCAQLKSLFYPNLSLVSSGDNDPNELTSWQTMNCVQSENLRSTWLGYMTHHSAGASEFFYPFRPAHLGLRRACNFHEVFYSILLSPL